MRRPICVMAVMCSLLAIFVSPLSAELIRFEILKREPFAGGTEFGTSGAYERIIGRAFFELDPKHQHNAEVVDLKYAPTNARGRVECSSDFFILAPVDPKKGNGAALYDVNNRGNKLALRFFNYANGGNDPVTAADAGDGFLLKRGFVVIWSGWDGELLPGGDRLQLQAPTATNNGQPITGKVRCELLPGDNGTRLAVVNWPNHGSYLPTAAGLAKATLTQRVLAGDPRVEIPRDQWKLHVTDSAASHQLPKVEIEVPAGLKKGQLYELIYEAQQPLVLGTCFTTVRDLISALKHGTGQHNPLVVSGQPLIKRAHGFGVSQSGRFLREMVYSGFNADESGRQVFNGIIPHVSGSGLGSFNHRFAQPTRHATQHDHADYPADRFPFAYEVQTDPLSGQTDGLLRRAVATNTAPFVLHTQSAAEYWTRAGSLSHTDALSKVDSKIPDNVRVYLFGGTQHGPAGYPPSKGDGQNLANHGDYRPFLRSLLIALDRWASTGEPAPSSVYPTIAAGTLVDWKPATMGFPSIPGVAFPKVIRQPAFLDFGPRWQKEGIIDHQPPVARGLYTMRVPKCDADGNEVDCLLPPEVAVPFGTFTGWNLRRADAGAEGQLVSLMGSYIPFAKTKAERESSGDPRLSLAERYSSVDDFASKFEAYSQKLAKQRYLLEDDVPQLLQLHRERAVKVLAK